MAKRMVKIEGPMKDVFQNAVMGGKDADGDRDLAKRAVKAILPTRPPDSPSDAMPRIHSTLPLLYDAMKSKDYDQSKGLIRQAITLLEGKAVDHVHATEV